MRTTSVRHALIVFTKLSHFTFKVENVLSKFGLLATTKAVAAGAKVVEDRPLLDLIHQGRYEDLVIFLIN